MYHVAMRSALGLYFAPTLNFELRQPLRSWLITFLLLIRYVTLWPWPWTIGP